MRILKDVLINNLIPFISYFDLKKFLETLEIQQNEIQYIKSKEHKKRITIKYYSRYTEYTIEDVLHNSDGPARIWTEGCKEWFINGKHHRLDGPAILKTDGSEIWYQHDKLHRLDGPAVTHYGYIEWLVNGRRHNPNGPAKIYPDGKKEWYLHDKLHNSDGPARIYANGKKEWWIYGKRIKQRKRGTKPRRRVEKKPVEKNTQVEKLN